MKDLNVIERLEADKDVLNKNGVLYQDIQDAINCIIGLKAENEALRNRLEVLSKEFFEFAEMEK